jgi:two-component system sensor histidine kinase UhpB
VREGDLSARAPRSALADPDLARVGEAFNDALERVALYRRKLGELAARSVRREEADRDRVARALHEDTGQRLAALLVRLRIAAGESQETAHLERLLEETREEIAAALDLIRAFASARRPRILDDLGLVAAVEAYARELGARGFEIEVDAGKWGDRREPELERDLYWIVREALDNVVEHSAARHTVVRLAGSEDGMSVEVEDDGRGFDVDGQGATALGLFEIRERAAAAGGSAWIESRPGSGTRVRVTVGRDVETPAG